MESSYEGPKNRYDEAVELQLRAVALTENVYPELSKALKLPLLCHARSFPTRSKNGKFSYHTVKTTKFIYTKPAPQILS